MGAFAAYLCGVQGRNPPLHPTRPRGPSLEHEAFGSRHAFVWALHVLKASRDVSHPPRASDLLFTGTVSLGGAGLAGERVGTVPMREGESQPSVRNAPFSRHPILGAHLTNATKIKQGRRGRDPPSGVWGERPTEEIAGVGKREEDDEGRRQGHGTGGRPQKERTRMGEERGARRVALGDEPSRRRLSRTSQGGSVDRSSSRASGFRDTLIITALALTRQPRRLAACRTPAHARRAPRRVHPNPSACGARASAPMARRGPPHLRADAEMITPTPSH